MKNSTLKELSLFIVLLLCFSNTMYSQQIGVLGNGIYINDNDLTPAVADFTDFQTNLTRTFTIDNIQNSGNTTLSISSITLSNTTDFTISSPLADTTISKNQTPEPFTITFNNLGGGTYTSIVTIASSNASNDGIDNVWIYTIQATGVVPLPEIDITGLGNSITDGDTTPSVTDDTDFGNVPVGLSVIKTYTINNIGTAALSIGAISFSGLAGLDYAVTTPPAASVGASGSTTFQVTFSPSITGNRLTTMSIVNNDSDENPYNFNITGNGFIPTPEIDITGLGNSIVDGDATPSATDDTDFGNVNEAGGTNVNTFTIENTGDATLNLTGISPYVIITGANAGDFTVTTIPAATITAGNNTTFQITFNPSALGPRTATITIANNDSNENPYNFDIKGEGVDLCGGTISSFPYTEDFESGIGAWTQDTGDDFNWTRQTGATPTASTGPAAANSGSFYLFTEANSNNNNTANIVTPCFDLTGTVNPRMTFYIHMKGGYLSGGSKVNYMGTLNVDLSTDSGLTFPVNLWNFTKFIQPQSTSAWIPLSIDLSSYIGQSIKIRIQGNIGSDDRSDMAIDNFSVTDRIDPSLAPGSVASDLAIWLKANDGLGYTNGQPVSLWEDQGRGSNMKTMNAGQEPTYRDTAAKNINFNPVVEFDNPYATYSIDNNYYYDDSSRQFLAGEYGFFTEDMFIVFMPDETPIDDSFGFMDVFCGDSDYPNAAADATGLGLGDYTGRITGEIMCYAHGSYTAAETNDGYAVSEIGTGSSYTNVGIINARNNVASTQQELYYNANDIETNQNDVAEFLNTDDTRFWLGRSEGWKASLNGRIAEVISYKSRQIDTDLTQERNRIQSYLAIKYGITLGVNGTSQDYVDSDGTVIWDTNTGVPVNDVFNFDIAGIGRDDASELLQKQSRSANNTLDGATRGQGVLTMGVSTIYNTNNLNPSTDLNDKEFLIWGNDGVDLDDPAVTVDIDMSSGVSPAIPGGTFVQFNGIARTWKVDEKGGDIPSVEVAILQSAVRTATPPTGAYLMFISDSPNFGPTADYRVMQEGTNELGEAILTTNYDFDGTKFITFGWAPERVYERSVYFDGTADYIDMENNLDLNASDFTISAWINRESGSNNTSILSKRDYLFTEGYDFKLNALGRVEVSWRSGLSMQSLTSSVTIPLDEWHQVAVIYSAGTATIYIDGIEDTSDTLSAPAATTQSFYIGAASKNTPTAFFKGNIDEVRIWDTALTETQLRYIMNQEITDNTSFVNGSYFQSQGVSPTKNDIVGIPWSDLAGYYPMTTYTYTNTKDESGKGNTGALRFLRTVDKQTAPLPYQSTTDGDWDTNTTWLNGSLQTIPGTTSIVDNTKTIDWNIVVTNHDVTVDNASLPAAKNENRALLGLFVASNTLKVAGDNTAATGNGITVTHMLSLDGKIDLEGESQLIQTEDSDLDITSAGTIEKDQQGTLDTFTYNYWSSPVGVSNTTSNNNSYTLNDNIFKDGSNPVAPVNMNFISGYDGADGTPISIANYWIWKFNNRTSQDYASWQHIRNTGTLLPGEGFTMKGVNNTSGDLSLVQNYTMEGKPNNGDITLPINAGNDYLIGNPYSSAIDADVFIINNTNTTGAIYYWEHFGGGTHTTIEYQGGYAVYNLSGGVQAIQYDFVTGGNDLSGGTGVKTPGRFIPVAQGFFVIGNTTGSLNFSNSHRTFTKEGATSVFLRNGQKTSNVTDNREPTGAVDNRLKLRLSFTTSNSYSRQLLVTRDSIATNAVDFGFDAINKDEQTNDMFWMIENEKFVIQGTNTINESTVLPLGIVTSENGINTFKIDELSNFPEDLQVFLHDKTLDTYHNLRTSAYQIELTAGQILNRFEITFTNQSLSIDEVETNNVAVYYANTSDAVIINNPMNIQIDQATIVNMLGQTVFTYNEITSSNYIELKTKNLSVGTYIINLKTETGEISKKVLVN